MIQLICAVAAVFLAVILSIPVSYTHLVDVIFTATPQGFLAGVLTEEILSRVKIIDLSADFRIKDVKTYEKWYKIEHRSPQFIEEAVYGLCELNRDKIKGARLIANPGCYTTCSILTAYPPVSYTHLNFKG